MKSNINSIRKKVCALLVDYRSIYKQYQKRAFITENDVDFMHYRYSTIILLRNIGLISHNTLMRSYHMLSNVRKRRSNYCQSVTN